MSIRDVLSVECSPETGHSMEYVVGVQFALCVLNECTCSTCADWAPNGHADGWGDCQSSASSIADGACCSAFHGCLEWRQKT